MQWGLIQNDSLSRLGSRKTRRVSLELICDVSDNSAQVGVNHKLKQNISANNNNINLLVGVLLVKRFNFKYIKVLSYLLENIWLKCLWIRRRTLET